MGDTWEYDYDGRGRLDGFGVSAAGAQRMQHETIFKPHLALESATTSFITSPASSYVGGALGRELPTTDGHTTLAWSWAYQNGQGQSTVTLVDSATYDGWNRLAKWRGVTNGVLVASEDYLFDRMGNVSVAADDATFDPTTERLVSRQTAAGRDTLLYDRAGNLAAWLEADGTEVLHLQRPEPAHARRV